jgi:hypothetical protein
MNEFIDNLLNMLFGCRHPEAQQSALPFRNGDYTYRVCLKCGLQAEYSIEDMCIVTPRYKRWKLRQQALENNHAQQSLSQQLVV